MCNKLGRFTNYVKDKINSALCIHKHQHVKCLTAVCGCCSFVRSLIRFNGSATSVRFHMRRSELEHFIEAKDIMQMSV